jgi:hypothetical protein
MSAGGGDDGITIITPERKSLAARAAAAITREREGFDELRTAVRRPKAQAVPAISAAMPVQKQAIEAVIEPAAEVTGGTSKS